jgi:hypothetical protein
MLVDDNVAGLRLEVVVESIAPYPLGEGLVLGPGKIRPR